jgi:VanZ family protein
MAVIVGLSTDAGSSEHTESWLLPVLRTLAPWVTSVQLDALHWLMRRLAHLSEYAILAALWLRAFVRGRSLTARTAGLLALAISVAWAILDELHQSFVPSRSASGADVLVDSVGAVVALTVAHVGWRQVADRATATLLWIALAGGAGVLLVNAIVGVPSGAVWLTAPTAAVALGVRTMLARQRSRRLLAPTPDASGGAAGVTDGSKRPVP